MPRKPPKGESLAEVNPGLAKQWHSTRNGDLLPFDFSSGSNYKVWWKCDKGDDHEWLASPNSRKNRGCPICVNKKVVLSNCLATTNPELSKQWHPTKNGDLTPFDLTAGSGKKVWWKCDKGDYHIWDTAVINRKDEGCPICSGHRTVFSTSIAKTHPELVSKWHPTKNNILTPRDVSAGSAKKVWWKCDVMNDHEYQYSVYDKITNKLGCPICAGFRVVTSNSLATTHPIISKEWHKTKNVYKTPSEFHAGSHTKVWWKCNKGDDHEWKAMIKSRTRGNKCPICRGLKVVSSNSLATLKPKLADQWHPIKNVDLTPSDVSLYSGKKVWWKCNKGDDHEWRVSISNRSNGSNCPFCDLTPQSKQELTITFELIKFFKEINPKGFKTRANGKLWSIDIYIPEFKLGIEFDGSYWHKDKRALDKLKTEKLEEDGFEVFRVREEPLKRIFDDDIMSKKPFNGKQVTNDILAQIMSRYNLDAKKIAKIETYIAKKELQNEKGLDKYIDMILTEKAEKKK